MHSENQELRKWNLLLLISMCAGLLLLGACQSVASKSNHHYTPPGQELRYENEVDRLIDSSRENPNAHGGIMLVGSSIFRLWNSVIDDFSEWPTVNHAFGGARTWELIEYAQNLIIEFKPRIVICYCGSNDINAGETAESIKRRVAVFMVMIESALPDAEIIYVAINRAPQKRSRWNVVDAANEEIRVLCGEQSNRYFVDVNTELFDELGEPRFELYQTDGLHFKPQAYQKVFTPMVGEAVRGLSSSDPAGF